MKDLNLTVRSWRDYELIDSGDNRKLERFGEYVLIRPETQALWRPARPEEWKRASAEFRFVEGKGSWVTMNNSSGKKSSGERIKEMPKEWQMQWGEVHAIIRPTSFKHVGIFPEQAANWEWIAERVMKLGGKSGATTDARKLEQLPKVLNLFGYTGIASIVAALAGAFVTHVDASRQSNDWAKENAQLSEVPRENIRYIFDDALKFVEREVRRGAEYDGIILDPPAFGRGTKGEVWKIEEDLSRLLAALEKIFSKKPGAFFLLNGYAAGYSPQSLRQAIESAFPENKKFAHAEFGELQIHETSDERCVPSGIYARFVR